MNECTNRNKGSFLHVSEHADLMEAEQKRKGLQHPNPE
jgi:hypothetical protein